jgi:hypothetical protein
MFLMIKVTQNGKHAKASMTLNGVSTKAVHERHQLFFMGKVAKRRAYSAVKRETETISICSNTASALVCASRPVGVCASDSSPDRPASGRSQSVGSRRAPCTATRRQPRVQPMGPAFQRSRHHAQHLQQRYCPAVALQTLNSSMAVSWLRHNATNVAASAGTDKGGCRPLSRRLG